MGGVQQGVRGNLPASFYILAS